jgi:hypothetical protein
MLRGSLSKHNTSGCFSPSRGTPDRLPVDGATTRRRNDGGAAWLGLGFGRRGVQAARVHGWDSGCGGCLNRTGFSACGPGGGSRARGRPARGRALPQSVFDLRSRMTGGARPSATAAGRPRRWAATGPKLPAGCARQGELRRPAGVAEGA